MKRPHPKMLWKLAIALLILAVMDIVLTTIGILFFHGKEGNPLIVALAELMPGTSPNVKIVHTVWLSKITIMTMILLLVRIVVKTKPERDDKIMFCGLSCNVFIYVFVIASWVWYFIHVMTLK